MQKMSGVELGFAVADLQQLSGKRIAKVRETEQGMFLLKIGSGEILFEPGVRLHLTRQVLHAEEKPSGFVSLLRKLLEGKTAQKISQHEGDRIVEIETRSKERLVFELFRKGNLILVGEDGKIIACLQREEAGGRRTAREEKYEYPKATPYLPCIPEKIAFLVQENEKGEPVSFSADSGKGGREFATFSEAADHYYANLKAESSAERKAGEKMKALGARLASQQATLEKIIDGKQEAKGMGDAIYRNFEKVEALLLLARKLKKEKKNGAEIESGLGEYGAKVAGSEVEVELE